MVWTEAQLQCPFRKRTVLSNPPTQNQSKCRFLKLYSSLKVSLMWMSSLPNLKTSIASHPRAIVNTLCQAPCSFSPIWASACTFSEREPCQFACQQILRDPPSTPSVLHTMVSNSPFYLIPSSAKVSAILNTVKKAFTSCWWHDNSILAPECK